MIRNQASQTIGAQMLNVSTGAAFAGAVTVYVTIDAGTQVIGSVGSGVCTAEGNGYYTYRPSAAETNGDLIGYTFIGTGAIPATIQVAPITVTQQTSLGVAGSGVAITVRDMMTEGFIDLGILSADEAMDPSMGALGLMKLTRLFDNLNAEQAGIYANRQATYTLTAGQNPHTIGPSIASPDFTVTQRPVSIDYASIVLTGDVHIPLNIKDARWYAGLTLPSLTSNIPMDLYYNPDWPNGQIYLYPVPASDYGLQLLTRIVLSDLALDDLLSLPPGYRDAITLTWEEMIAPSYPAAVPPTEAAARSRGRIFANNDVTPSLATCDSGIPSQTGRTGAWFDWHSGLMRSAR